MYADYIYYATVYYDRAEDKKIPQEFVKMYLKRASAFLDHLFGVSKPKAPYDECLCDACCEIADCLYSLNEKEGITRETNDGYSVTFANNPPLYRAVYEIALKHLGFSGLLYRGIE